MSVFRTSACALVCGALILACGDVEDPHDHNEQEVITTVTLRFSAAGNDSEFSFDDPDGDGGNAPMVDPIALTVGSTYTVSVLLLNKLEMPAEDLTSEVLEEDDEHQLFFLGDAVSGPATSATDGILLHRYDDMDAAGNPVGLQNTIVARSAGSGRMTLVLRHLPPLDGVAVKAAMLAADVASGGVASIAGDTDVSVDFDVTVQ